MTLKIPLIISDDEVIVRGIVHPLFYSISKGRLKEHAFLPPPNKYDVSVLRLSYTNESFCKRHSKALKLGESLYCGLAAFKVDDFNKHRHQVNRLDILLKATPLDGSLKYISKEDIFSTDIGLPMHADIIYPSSVEAEVNTLNRKFAKEMLQYVKYYHDNYVQEEEWKESSISL